MQILVSYSRHCYDGFLYVPKTWSLRLIPVLAQQDAFHDEARDGKLQMTAEDGTGSMDPQKVGALVDAGSTAIRKDAVRKSALGGKSVGWKILWVCGKS